MFLYYFAYQPIILVELRFRRRVVVIVCYRFCFYMFTLHQLILEPSQVPTIAQRGVHAGKPVAIDVVYECDEIARDAQLEVFFQQTKEQFDVLSKQFTTLAVGIQPQNYHPNPCFVEEEDLNIKQEGCNIKEDNEYIERVCLVE